jgi:hypothetical protein
MDAATLYDEDIYAWAMDQAEALRRVGRSRPELTNTVDWAHVAEEIEDVGSEKLNKVESLLRRALAHLVAYVSSPHSDPAKGWAGEIGTFLTDARRTFTRSMRQKLDMEEIWRDALIEAEGKLTPYGESLRDPLPKACPFALDELLSKPAELQRLREVIEQGTATERP